MSKVVGALVAVCLSAPVLAQEQRLTEKASSWIDRNPRHLIRELNNVGFYPSLGNLGEGAGSGPGLAYFNPNFAGTPIDLHAGAAWSFKGDTTLNLRVGRIPHVPGGAPSKRRSLEALTSSLADGSNARPFFVYGEVRHQMLANGRLYGSEADSAIPFVYKDESYEVVVGYRVAPRLVASVRTGLLEAHATLDMAPGVSSPKFVDGPAASGRDLSFLATTGSLAYDHRDQPRDPHSGTFVEASLARYQQRGAGSSSFDRFSLDARQYFPLGSERHVLALRGLLAFDSTQGGDTVPFFLERTLGGSRTLRGYAQYRFRGPKMATVSAEYRYEVKGPFELAAFYDGGKVWGGLAEMGTPGFASSYGVGLRIKSKDDVLIRIDAARGSEVTRANLSFGYSF